MRQVCTSHNNDTHPMTSIIYLLRIMFCFSAERESGRLRDEMKRFDLERIDLREKLNVYEVHYIV